MDWCVLGSELASAVIYIPFGTLKGLGTLSADANRRMTC